MKSVRRFIVFLAIAFFSLISVSAAQAGPSVNMLVTVEARHGSTPPDIAREDVMVYQGHDRDAVTGWQHADANHLPLQLFVLLDDAANISLGSQLEDLSQFIRAQSPSTLVGVAYMLDGNAQVLQNPTTDHALAAKALHLPLGNPGVNASPYFSLSDLIKRWPATDSARREVLMITDGIDRYWGGGTDDPYVDDAIADAQKAGILVYTIYTPGVGHDMHSGFRVFWGQNYLSEIADETGGESYYIGFNGPAVSFSPFLESLSNSFTRQYLLTFTAKPEKKAGRQRVRLQTEVPNAELRGASQVFVPAAL